MKLSRRKDANKIRLLKKGLNDMDAVLTRRSTSTIVYVPITKCCGVNVETFIKQIYSLFLGDNWYNEIKNRWKWASLYCYSPKRFGGVVSR